MAKTLEAQEQSLAKIFSDDYVLTIPGYQRPYSWGLEQAQELFDDVFGSMQPPGTPIESMSPYFLGSIVLIKASSTPQADVIDGQQRLTTVTLLLAALRASVGEPSASDITQFIYEKGNSIKGTKDSFRLTLRERDADFFQQYVQKEGGLSSLGGNKTRDTLG